LGASGDLSPLAHLALPLIGLGEVKYNNQRISGKEILDRFNWEKINLQSKEGLALLNGTQFMTAYGIYNLLKAHKVSYLTDLIGTISLEAFDGRIEPFNELVQLVRPHDGQIKTAKRIREFLAGSQLIKQEKKHVQDPYSFRCIPQVHGASKDTIKFVTKTFLTEINSVTDNPNIFVEEDQIISGAKENRDKYREKFEIFQQVLGDTLPLDMPEAGFYLWSNTLPAAKGSDEDFARELFAKQNVTVLPGRYLGRVSDGINPGENRIRMALVAPVDECREAAERIKRFIHS
jgi:histidine ammonia-lyase